MTRILDSFDYEASILGLVSGDADANPEIADWPSAWRHFYEESVLVKIDGSAVVRLAHHRSRSAEYYWAQSRAAISRDGRYVLFDSNVGLANTGLNKYSDVYMIKVRREPDKFLK